MASELLVVQVVQFFASCQSLADSSLFHTVRDIVQCWQWQGKGLKAQYWGTSIKQANDFYWLLFWPSRDHVAAFKADPSYPAFLQKRQSLATAPVYDVLVQFSGSPKRCLEAPISKSTSTRHMTFM
ncbi:hypothetical protein B0F90DRAFT_1823093 [Multifurca ochricompacta]|uniref:Uncharacterized protein n=1 Tax=Multifurca ochricompacta TaxID=376703 RepID=A0AAD4LXZ2_9AGAM|nr:hypothetical protein B0F90DRAFT_1823093 [Multifurca ochricompacta]